MFLLITCFIEYFDVRWIKMRPPCKKTTVTSWVPWGCRVRTTASGVRVSVVSRVVGYVDIMTTPIAKSGSMRVTSVHCILLVLVLCQLYRIVSFDVMEREDKCFTGVRITCARTSWNRRTMWSYVKKLEENLNPLRKGTKNNSRGLAGLLWRNMSKIFETWSKWPLWSRCCSAGVLNKKHFYRWYGNEEILMAKKLTWNDEGLELLSKENRLNLLQHPLHTPPPPPPPLRSLKK